MSARAIAQATRVLRLAVRSNSSRNTVPRSGAGLRRVTVHALRHGYASALISAGANIKIVQRLMGHSSAQMTLNTYAHAFADDADGIAEALSARVFGDHGGNFLDTSKQKQA